MTLATKGPPMAQTLPATMPVDDRKHYRMGFVASGKDFPGQLDEAEARYEKANNPTRHQWHRWMDGYMDRANREFGHIPNCAGHDDNECGEG
jgi:hypothetical protein